MSNYLNSEPAVGAFTISAGASALAHTTRAIYVGTAGNITVTTEKGESVQFTNVSGILPIRVTHVTAATASGIVGLY